MSENQSAWNQKVDRKTWFLVFIGAMIGVGYGIFSDMKETPKKATAKVNKAVNYESKTTIQLAWNFNKKLIKTRLKAPSTAKFPSFWNAPDHVTYLGNKRYKIRSWVDAQNSFGANIRQNYVSTIRMGNSDTHWTLEEVQFF
jgi:hypothetical protein